MRHRRSLSGGVAVVAFVLLAGCGGESTPATSTTTTTTVPVATSQPSETTTTVAKGGPQPLTSGGVLEPGEYVTTVFEPTSVMYRIERNYPLRAFHDRRVSGFEKYLNRQVFDEDSPPYTGIAVHGLWHTLTPAGIIEVLESIEPLAVGQPTSAEVGGFTGQRIEGSVKRRAVLWSKTHEEGGSRLLNQWLLQPGRVDFILLETPVGTLLITIEAIADEWDEFLPVAEEILAGISFPDLE